MSKEASNNTDKPQLVYTFSGGGARLAVMPEEVPSELEQIDYTFYPNTANNEITISGQHLKGAKIGLSDLSGRFILKKIF